MPYPAIWRDRYWQLRPVQPLVDPNILQFKREGRAAFIINKMFEDLNDDIDNFIFLDTSPLFFEGDRFRREMFDKGGFHLSRQGASELALELNQFADGLSEFLN